MHRESKAGLRRHPGVDADHLAAAVHQRAAAIARRDHGIGLHPLLVFRGVPQRQELAGIRRQLGRFVHSVDHAARRRERQTAGMADRNHLLPQAQFLADRHPQNGEMLRLLLELQDCQISLRAELQAALHFGCETVVKLYLGSSRVPDDVKTGGDRAPFVDDESASQASRLAGTVKHFNQHHPIADASDQLLQRESGQLALGRRLLLLGWLLRCNRSDRIERGDSGVRSALLLLRVRRQGR